MSKERLEEIKKHRNEADNSTDEYEFEKINFYNLHVVWLIEQAERVQELENKLENVMDRHTYLEGDYYDLQKQNERYREYLELIRITGTHGKDIKTGEIIRSDEANLAEEALEGAK